MRARTTAIAADPRPHSFFWERPALNRGPERVPVRCTMAIPVVPIISAVTPLVLGAFDLYRRRSEARTTSVSVADAGQLPRLAEALQQRMQGLEESDLEQARLLSDVAKSVENLARALESQLAAARAREERSRRWLIATTLVAAAAVVLALWGLAG